MILGDCFTLFITIRHTAGFYHSSSDVGTGGFENTSGVIMRIIDGLLKCKDQMVRCILVQ